MFQKRTLRLLLVLFVVIVLAVVGCTGGKQGAGDNEEENGEAAGPAPMKFTFKTASLGGNMHIIGGALGKILEDNVPGSIITVETGGSGSNPLVVGSGDAALGTTMFSNARQAFDGREPFDEEIKNVATLANFQINQFITFVTTNKLYEQYKTLQEMIDAKHPMKVVTGEPGQTSTQLIIWLLEEGYGITFDDIRSWGGSVTHVSHADAANLMKDGHADVYACIASYRFPTLVDLQTSMKLNFLELDKVKVDQVAEDRVVLTGTMPGGTYDNIPDDRYTLMETQLLIANTDLVDDEMAYNIVKLMHENLDELKSAHADMNNFVMENAPIDTGFPLHPGAEKYYKEQGLL